MTPVKVKVIKKKISVVTYPGLGNNSGSATWSGITGNITAQTDLINYINGQGFITGITSGMVTAALGFTPYNSSNPAGYITSSTLSAINGITKTGTVFELGGTLTKDTSIIGVDFNYETEIQNTVVGALSRIYTNGDTFEIKNIYSSSGDGFKLYSNVDSDNQMYIYSAFSGSETQVGTGIGTAFMFGQNGGNYSSFNLYNSPLTIVGNGGNNHFVLRDGFANKGLVGESYYGANTSPNAYVQNKWVADNFVNQTDLQNALNLKYDASNPAGYITGVTLTNANVTGVLPINKGGTNSNTTLINNKVIVSNSGAIVEDATLLLSDYLSIGASGLWKKNTTTHSHIGISGNATDESTSLYFSKSDASKWVKLKYDPNGNGAISIENQSGGTYLSIDEALNQVNVVNLNVVSTFYSNDKAYFGGTATPTAFVDIKENSLVNASLRINESAVNVASPNNGDFWYNGRLFFRDGATTETVAYLSDISGGSGLTEMQTRRTSYLFNH